MDIQAARQVIEMLAQGIHPVTGERMPQDSPYNAPQVIRALFTVSMALQAPPPAPVPVVHKVSRKPAEAPANAGKPWSPADDAAVVLSFDSGEPLKELATRLGRTQFSVEQRLVKMPPAPGGARYRVSEEIRYLC